MDIPAVISQLIEQSLALERLGQISTAIQHAKLALERAQALNQADALAAAQTCLATLHFRIGHYAEAQALAIDALTLSSKDSTTRADALLILGNCAAETHSLAEAEAYYHRAVDVSRAIGYQRVLMRARNSLAIGVYLPRGQFDLALAAAEEAHRICQERNLSE